MLRELKSVALGIGLSLSAGALPAFAQSAQVPAAASEANPKIAEADQAYRARDFVKSIKLCDEVLAGTPNSDVALYLRGSSKVELGISSSNAELVRQGIADAREALRHEGNGKPEYYFPYIYGMSHLAQMEGKPAHAQTALSVAEDILEKEGLTPDQRANLIYQRAQANMQLGQPLAVEADVKEVLAIQPKHLAALMLLADMSAKHKTPAEAYTAYSKVVQEFPDNPLTYNNRGMFLQSQGRNPESLADFTKAIQIDPKFMPAYVNRGFAYLEAGDAASAETAFTQALAVDPTHMGAMSLRATARLNSGRTQEALADYRAVVQNAPQSPMAHADLGFAQFFAGDFNGALASFDTAMKIDARMRFLAPWKLASEKRLQRENTAAYQAVLAKVEGERDWIDLLQLFMLNKVDANQLLQSVNSNDQAVRDAQLCEGYYFIGVELQRRGRAADAIAYFRQATQKKLPKLSAYRGALLAISADTNQAQK